VLIHPLLSNPPYLKYVRIFSAPTTSERTTWPLLLTRMFTLSTTSRNTWKQRPGGDQMEGKKT